MPDRRAVLGVVEDVVDHVEAVQLVAHRHALAARAPQPPLRRVPRLLAVVGRFFLGNADPLPRVVVGEAGEDVLVDPVHRRRGDFNVATV